LFHARLLIFSGSFWTSLFKSRSYATTPQEKKAEKDFGHIIVHEKFQSRTYLILEDWEEFYTSPPKTESKEEGFLPQHYSYIDLSSSPEKEGELKRKIQLFREKVFLPIAKLGDAILYPSLFLENNFRPHHWPTPFGLYAGLDAFQLYRILYFVPNTDEMKKNFSDVPAISIFPFPLLHDSIIVGDTKTSRKLLSDHLKKNFKLNLTFQYLGLEDQKVTSKGNPDAASPLSPENAKKLSFVKQFLRNRGTSDPKGKNEFLVGAPTSQPHFPSFYLLHLPDGLLRFQEFLKSSPAQSNHSFRFSFEVEDALLLRNFIARGQTLTPNLKDKFYRYLIALLRTGVLLVPKSNDGTLRAASTDEPMRRMITFLVLCYCKLVLRSDVPLNLGEPIGIQLVNFNSTALPFHCLSVLSILFGFFTPPSTASRTSPPRFPDVVHLPSIDRDYLNSPLHPDPNTGCPLSYEEQILQHMKSCMSQRSFQLTQIATDHFRAKAEDIDFHDFQRWLSFHSFGEDVYAGRSVYRARRILHERIFNKQEEEVKNRFFMQLGQATPLGSQIHYFDGQQFSVQTPCYSPLLNQLIPDQYDTRRNSSLAVVILDVESPANYDILFGSFLLVFLLEWMMTHHSPAPHQHPKEIHPMTREDGKQILLILTPALHRLGNRIMHSFQNTVFIHQWDTPLSYTAIQNAPILILSSLLFNPATKQQQLDSVLSTRLCEKVKSYLIVPVEFFTNQSIFLLPLKWKQFLVIGHFQTFLQDKLGAFNSFAQVLNLSPIFPRRDSASTPLILTTEEKQILEYLLRFVVLVSPDSRLMEKEQSQKQKRHPHPPKTPGTPNLFPPNNAHTSPSDSDSPVFNYSYPSPTSGFMPTYSPYLYNSNHQTSGLEVIQKPSSRSAGVSPSPLSLRSTGPNRSSSGTRGMTTPHSRYLIKNRVETPFWTETVEVVPLHPQVLASLTAIYEHLMKSAQECIKIKYADTWLFWSQQNIADGHVENATEILDHLRVYSILCMKRKTEEEEKEEEQEKRKRKIPEKKKKKKKHLTEKNIRQLPGLNLNLLRAYLGAIVQCFSRLCSVGLVPCVKAEYAWAPTIPLEQPQQERVKKGVNYLKCAICDATPDMWFRLFEIGAFRLQKEFKMYFTAEEKEEIPLLSKLTHQHESSRSSKDCQLCWRCQSFLIGGNVTAVGREEEKDPTSHILLEHWKPNRQRYLPLSTALVPMSSSSTALTVFPLDDPLYRANIHFSSPSTIPLPPPPTVPSSRNQRTFFCPLCDSKYPLQAQIKPYIPICLICRKKGVLQVCSSSLLLEAEKSCLIRKEEQERCLTCNESFLDLMQKNIEMLRFNCSHCFCSKCVPQNWTQAGSPLAWPVFSSCPVCECPDIPMDVPPDQVPYFKNIQHYEVNTSKCQVLYQKIKAQGDDDFVLFIVLSQFPDVLYRTKMFLERAEEPVSCVYALPKIQEEKEKSKKSPSINTSLNAHNLNCLLQEKYPSTTHHPRYLILLTYQEAVNLPPNVVDTWSLKEDINRVSLMLMDYDYSSLDHSVLDMLPVIFFNPDKKKERKYGIHFMRAQKTVEEQFGDIWDHEIREKKDITKNSHVISSYEPPPPPFEQEAGEEEKVPRFESDEKNPFFMDFDSSSSTGSLDSHSSVSLISALAGMTSTSSIGFLSSSCSSLGTTSTQDLSSSSGAIIAPSTDVNLEDFSDFLEPADSFPTDLLPPPPARPSPSPSANKKESKLEKKNKISSDAFREKRKEPDNPNHQVSFLGQSRNKRQKTEEKNSLDIFFPQPKFDQMIPVNSVSTLNPFSLYGETLGKEDCLIDFFGFRYLLSFASMVKNKMKFKMG
jgi:hypothetical protein